MTRNIDQEPFSTTKGDTIVSPDTIADIDSSAAADARADAADKTEFQIFMREWFPYIIFFIAVLLFRITILINAVIPSESMVATIQKGDHVIGLKSTYWFAEPERGDIVVFHAPDTPETLYIKRVIGTPGDTVVITDGKTYTLYYLGINTVDPNDFQTAFTADHSHLVAGTASAKRHVYRRR